MRKAIVTGIVTGLLLICFLFLTDYFTNRMLLPLLLNVDFIPVLAQANLAIEIGLHLLISIAICITLFSARLFSLKMYNMMLIILFLFTLTLYPILLTVSVKTFGEITDPINWIVWTLSHVFYFFICHVLLKNTNQKIRSTT
ncbi:MAG: hypothetical protein ACRCWQ_00040 [Bacilli bacterium]